MRNSSGITPPAMRYGDWRRCIWTLVGLVFLFGRSGYPDSLIPRDSLIADVWQLGSIIESVHPDPYHNTGGRIEFHRRLQTKILGIPEIGMTREDFYCLLCPFMTGIGDSHTWLRFPEESSFRVGLPLYLGVVSDGLFVAGAPSEEYRHLLGARLIDIEGVPIDEIIRRAHDFVSGENEYQIFRNFNGFGMLFNKWYLDRLIPACQGRAQVAVTLLKTDGTTISQPLQCSMDSTLSSYVWMTSQCSLPSRQRSDFVYSFMDSGKQTALLAIDDLNTYREAFEMWRDEGRFADCANDASELYRRYNSGDPPIDEEALIAGLPSATELFIAICEEMKQAGTRTLIVDLRRNEGGNSAMAEILTYFLYGKDQLLSIEARQFEVLKCSPLYLERHPGVDLHDLAQHRGVAVSVGDYMFDPPGYPERLPDSQEVRIRFENWAEAMPTFYAEYLSGKHSRYYLPENVLVISSARTFSSGFTVMYYLSQAGARTVGVPSAQAGNCFGDVMDFTLANSNLYFIVPCKYFLKFPDEPDKGKVLMPDYPLTYEILSSYDFDTNASLLYAMDLAGKTGTRGR